MEWTESDTNAGCRYGKGKGNSSLLWLIQHMGNTGGWRVYHKRHGGMVVESLELAEAIAEMIDSGVQSADDIKRNKFVDRLLANMFVVYQALKPLERWDGECPMNAAAELNCQIIEDALPQALVTGQGCGTCAHLSHDDDFKHGDCMFVPETNEQLPAQCKAYGEPFGRMGISDGVGCEVRKPVTYTTDEVTADLRKIDWDQLRDQKVELLSTIALDDDQELHESVKALTGILHLVDHIQDEAALTLGELAVFGVLKDE